MTLKLLMAITIAAILICAVPVSAENVTSWPDGSNVTLNNWTIENQPISHYYVTEQDQIVSNALDKQNKLLEELVKVQWVETCYSNYSGYGNVTALKSECANAGYPLGE